MKNYSCLGFDYWQLPSVKNLSSISKLVNTFLATFENLNLIGVARVLKETIAGELNLTLEEVNNAYLEISERDFIIFCDKTDHYWIPSILDWLPVIDINKVGNAQMLFNRIPNICTFKSSFYQCNEFVLSIDFALHMSARAAKRPLPSPFKLIASPIDAPPKPPASPVEVCSSSSSRNSNFTCSSSSSNIDDLIFGNPLSLYLIEFDNSVISNKKTGLDFEYVFKKFKGVYKDKNLNNDLALIRFFEFVGSEREKKIPVFQEGSQGQPIINYDVDKTINSLNADAALPRTAAAKIAGLAMARLAISK